MKTNAPATIRIVLVLGLLGAATALAFDAGGFAYTKRVETAALTEPRPLAPPAGKFGFRRKLKVEQVQGNWARVSDGPIAGWVYFGNLSETMPPEIRGTDGLPLTASQTTASAAARPLTPEADAYAARRNLGQARNDLNWMQYQCKSVTAADVAAYLKAQKKGEYQ